MFASSGFGLRRCAVCVRRLLVVCLLLSFVLPAAPTAAVAAGGIPAVAPGASVSSLPAQEDEPYPAGPPDPEPYIPDVPLADPDSLPEPATLPPVGEAEPPLVTLAPAPVLLELGSAQAVVAAGEPFTLTVRASGMDDAATVEGLAVNLHLPAGVALAGSWERGRGAGVDAAGAGCGRGSGADGAVGGGRQQPAAGV